MFQQKLLIAKPMLKDPVFGGRVVLIVKYDKITGSEGFVLNGPIVGKIGYGDPKNIVAESDDLTENLVKSIDAGKLDSVDLRFGGPCRTSGFLMIHGYEKFSNKLMKPADDEFQLGKLVEHITQTKQHQDDDKIMDGIYFGTPDTWATIVKADLVKEGKFRFFSGMAGWSPGQLEREIEIGAWDVKDATPELVFTDKLLEELVHKPENVKEKSLFQSMMKPSLN